MAVAPISEPLPPAPSPKRRGGAGQKKPGETGRSRRTFSPFFLPLSASGRGPGGGVLQSVSGAGHPRQVAALVEYPEQWVGNADRRVRVELAVLARGGP